MLRFILELYPNISQPGTTFQKSYLCLEEPREEGQESGWGPTGDAVWVNAPRPRGGQKIPKETLVPRGKRGLSFGGSITCMLPEFSTDPLRPPQWKNPFISFCASSTWLVWEIFQLSEL